MLAVMPDLTDVDVSSLAPLRPLPYPGPTYRGQRYVGRQTLAFATPSSSELWQVALAARTRAAIRQLTASTTGIGWDIAPADDDHAG